MTGNLQSIIKHIRVTFEIDISKISPMTGGWLNKKWLLHTTIGNLVLKQYAPERNKHHGLDRIEKSLKYQEILRHKGLLCPRIYKSNGTYIQHVSKDIDYIVMDYVYGEIAKPDNVTVQSLSALGEQTGLMHYHFDKLTEKPLYVVKKKHVIML